ncbi:TPA: hypothetical protein N0F65_007575 [Lagenidium giganteum]|uniref:Uncharacterized protein n=1 Tax=Lagenidium giganteum TaxID=4803 RepID=A0AAV2ZD78_9STRA|nr:TPA: hypothetical protein N0F65_007575 [Lagenidium giganteum]
MTSIERPILARSSTVPAGQGHMTVAGAFGISLPKLRIPSESEMNGPSRMHATPLAPSPTIRSPLRGSLQAAFPSPVVPNTMLVCPPIDTTVRARTPKDMGDLRSPSSPSSYPPFGMSHLLHAAEHCRSGGSGMPRKRSLSETPQAPALPSLVSKMQSIGYAMEPSCDQPALKRTRSDCSAFTHARMTAFNAAPVSSMPATYSSAPPSSGMPTHSLQSATPSVWERVVATGKFPAEICLNEGTTSGNKNVDMPSEYPSSPTNSRGESFNALSIKNIMNDDKASRSPSPKKRSLKRSDYSQHGVVRSGRWSTEEENYAKAMIDAFKSGYLPLHGNVSLRKFLSEVLVCHPMRVSKKFVGYVRKYHWYRIAAGKCDPELKHQALQNLCRLERIFWTSLQQNNDWPLPAASGSC